MPTPPAILQVLPALHSGGVERGTVEIAQAIARGPMGPHVLVVGHPFIDVWQAVKPQRLGFERSLRATIAAAPDGAAS